MRVRNQWAQPEGYAEAPPPVRYRIRGAEGAIVERLTAVAHDYGRQRYYHSLAPEDQAFADAIVALVQRACSYFYAPDADYEPLEGVAGVFITDAEVIERIERLEQGEHAREAERTKQLYFPLTELPFDQQRALIEQIELLKGEWQFEVLGEVART